jgi:hypothetical protein
LFIGEAAQADSPVETRRLDEKGRGSGRGASLRLGPFGVPEFPTYLL